MVIVGYNPAGIFVYFSGNGMVCVEAFMFYM